MFSIFSWAAAMKRSIALIGIGLVALAVAACTSISSQENFKQIIGASVGKSMSAPARVTNAYPEDLVSSRTLANGNIENEYRYQGACLYFYEFDPATTVIVRWRFEGPQSDCRINP